jgi:hypothetical protein
MGVGGASAGPTGGSNRERIVLSGGCAVVGWLFHGLASSPSPAPDGALPSWCSLQRVIYLLL